MYTDRGTWLRIVRSTTSWLLDYKCWGIGF